MLTLTTIFTWINDYFLDFYLISYPFSLFSFVFVACFLTYTGNENEDNPFIYNLSKSVKEI